MTKNIDTPAIQLSGERRAVTWIGSKRIDHVNRPRSGAILSVKRIGQEHGTAEQDIGIRY